jgi:hypothetical protein
MVNIECKFQTVINRATLDPEESVDPPLNNTVITQDSFDRSNSTPLVVSNMSNDTLVPELTHVSPSNVTTHQKECDFLILGDSVLRRILPKRFTPRGSTIKRFIRGGAVTCCNFVQKYGLQFLPKNVIIHVGTRDVQGENIGFKETDYIDLIKVCRESWRDTNLYISLITERKDIQTDYVLQANQIIRSACEKTQDLGIHVSIIEQFKPGEDMFHDDVHLNNKGVATIVKHIKGAVGLSSSRVAKHANIPNI